MGFIPNKVDSNQVIDKISDKLHYLAEIDQAA